MDGCVVAVQVEDLGLPKSAVGTVGQTSKMFSILTLDFQAVRSRIWESPKAVPGRVDKNRTRRYPGGWTKIPDESSHEGDQQYTVLEAAS